MNAIRSQFDGLSKEENLRGDFDKDIGVFSLQNIQLGPSVSQCTTH